MTNNQETEVKPFDANLFFAQLNKLIIKDINDTKAPTSLNTKYSRDKIIKFLENPEQSQKELRKLSDFLYASSPHYKRLINYFAGMHTFAYTVTPYGLNVDKVNMNTFKIQYQKTLNTVENMNIKHEFKKILKTAFKHDVFYGYEHENAESYFIQKLNPDLCEISSIEDGVYNFRFDFQYFDRFKNQLNKYPEEFRIKYKVYETDKTNKRWQELDSSKTICIKVNEEVDYPLLPFSNIFEAVYDIDEKKRANKISTKIDNYMILTQKIPMAETKDAEPNRFLLDLDTASGFHARAAETLPDEVGLITSPMDIEAVKLERKNKDVDYVAQAERSYYDAAGVSQLLFNGDKSTSTSLGKSVNVDEMMVFDVVLQMERWLNRKLKNLNKAYKFKVNILPVTNFNIKEKFDLYLQSAQNGFPTRQEVSAILEISPSEMISKLFLENEVLGLSKPGVMMPLASSHTQSGDTSNGGQPVKEDDSLSDAGLKTRENEGNANDYS